MQSTREPMICPYCGVPMNHHADKVFYFSSPDAADGMRDDAEVVEEFHTCPNCGRAAARPA